MASFGMKGTKLVPEKFDCFDTNAWIVLVCCFKEELIMGRLNGPAHFKDK